MQCLLIFPLLSNILQKNDYNTLELSCHLKSKSIWKWNYCKTKTRKPKIWKPPSLSESNKNGRPKSYIRFLVVKILQTVSVFMLSTLALWVAMRARWLSLSSVIVDRWSVNNRFSMLKDRSALLLVIGAVSTSFSSFPVKCIYWIKFIWQLWNKKGWLIDIAQLD